MPEYLEQLKQVARQEPAPDRRSRVQTAEEQQAAHDVAVEALFAAMMEFEGQATRAARTLALRVEQLPGITPRDQFLYVSELAGYKADPNALAVAGLVVTCEGTIYHVRRGATLLARTRRVETVMQHVVRELAPMVRVPDEREGD